MSESQQTGGGREEIWLEKYRPQHLSGIVGQDSIVERLESYVSRRDLPHMLFAGPAGVGKTTASVAVARGLYGEAWEEHFLELNASDERGIDVVRDRVKSFARTSFGGVDHRIIFLDEADALCVPPGTEVVTGYSSSPEVEKIEDVDEDGEPIPSVDFETNAIQSDRGKLVDSGIADFFELELEDGRSVLASPTHPFFVVGEDGTLVEKELRELSPGDEIADFKDDVGVSRCEACGDWTAGRFCSIACKNESHSLEMQGEDNPMYGTEWSDERRQKIVAKLSDGRLAGENNPNRGGDFHGVPLWEMDEGTVEQFRETLSEMRSGTTWDEWVVDADPERVKKKIGHASSEWWDSELPHHEHYNREEFEPTLVSDGGPRTVHTVAVRDIEYSHRGKAYNISMEGTPNFMLANGILTHNTSDAQSALRRTMEQFSNNVRFILSCNYSSQIIDPIQSRCAVFRFSPLSDGSVAEQVRHVADAEGIEVTEDGVDALVYAADGDMRKAINGLQAAAVTGGVVDEEAVFEITSTARPEEIRETITLALDGDFTAARSRLDALLTEEGIAGGDIIDQLHRSVWEFEMDDEAAVRLLDRIGEADYRVTEGANERIQLEALLASLALDG
jgi:DNA polymerase III delta prime subunit